MAGSGLSPNELAGLGLFVVGLAIVALSVGLPRMLGWGYAGFLTLEGMAFCAAGLAMAFGMSPVPLEGQRALVVSGALAAVGLWHIAMITLWPMPRHHGNRP